MPFDPLREFGRIFSGSTERSLLNIGTLGGAGLVESNIRGAELLDDFIEQEGDFRRDQSLLELDDESAEVARLRDERERLRQRRQPGRRQTLLSIQGDNALLTGF